MNKKYGILVLSYWNALYDHFDKLNSIVAYKNNTPIKFVYNDIIQNKTLLPHDMFYKTDIAYPKSLLTMLEKFIWAWNAIKDTKSWRDCNYIIRANSSTFLNHPILQQHIDTLPAINCYSGHIMFNEFVSGTCMIFSRDMLDNLTTQFMIHQNIRYTDHDDCIISKLLYNIPMIDMNWYCFDKNIKPEINEIETSLKYPIIRVRNDLNRTEIDIDIWNKLFETNMG